MRRRIKKVTVRVRHVAPKLRRRTSVFSGKLWQDYAGSVTQHRGGVMEENRKLKQFLAIAAIVSLINGVSYTLAPGALLPNYGIQPDPGAVLGFRLLGAALLTFGLILWFLRNSREWIALRGLLIGASVGNAAGFIVSAWATIDGVMNGAGWLFVATYGVLLLGYAYSLWALSRKAA
jgi:hypothetical protein